MIARYAPFLFYVLALPVMADVPLKVEVVIVTAAPDIHINTLVGEIVAREKLVSSFPAGGRVVSVEVEEGDIVKAGQALARMESVQQEQALRAAEAGVASARADFSQAREDLERQVSLLQRGATTRIARDEAEDALHVAEGSLTQAAAEVDRARNALDDTVLRAEHTATVIDRMVEPGQVVGAAQQVFELAIGNQFDALFEVPEALLTEEGNRPAIELNLLDEPSVGFNGKIREVAPLVDPQSGTVDVKVSVENAPEGTTYGDAVRGVARIKSPDRIVLPYAAMSVTRDGPAVWVVDSTLNTVSITPIVVDRFETGKIIVKNGLMDGDIVVSRGSHLLYPGRSVSYSEASQ